MKVRGVGGELRLELLRQHPIQCTAEPDIHVRVSATTSHFSVNGSNAWLERSAVEAFITELGKFNGTLVGRVQLLAMSPRAFELTVENLNSKGHIGIAFTIGANIHTDNGSFHSSVSGGFEVSPRDIQDLLEGFKALISTATSD